MLGRLKIIDKNWLYRETKNYVPKDLSCKLCSTKESTIIVGNLNLWELKCGSIFTFTIWWVNEYFLSHCNNMDLIENNINSTTMFKSSMHYVLQMWNIPSSLPSRYIAKKNISDVIWYISASLDRFNMPTHWQKWLKTMERKAH